MADENVTMKIIGELDLSNVTSGLEQLQGMLETLSKTAGATFKGGTITIKMSGAGEGAAAAKKSGMLGPLNEMASGITGMLGPIGAIAALIGALVKSSASFGSVFKGFIRLFMMLVKPIGDTLALFLKPLYQLLAPMMRAYNQYMRIYQKEASQAIKAGGIFAKAGMMDKAAESYMTAFMVAMKPFLNLSLLAIGEGVKLLADIILWPIQAAFEAIGVAFDAIGLEGVGDSFREAATGVEQTRDKVKNFIDEGMQKLIEVTDDMIFNHIADLKTASEGVGILLEEMKGKPDTLKAEYQATFEAMDTMTTSELAKLTPQIKTAFETIKTDGTTKIGGLADSLNNTLTPALAKVKEQIEGISEASSGFSAGGLGGGGGGGGAGGPNVWDYLMAGVKALLPEWLKNYIRQFIPNFQEGGTMPYEGLAYLHKGERVIPSAAGSTTSYEINVNTPDYELKSLIESTVEHYLRVKSTNY